MYRFIKILFLVTLLVCLAVLGRTQTQAVCLSTDEVSQQEVTATFVLESDHLNYLTIVDESGNEQVIETTDSHPFWVVTDEPDLERAARSVVDENGIILYHENLESGLNGFWVEAKDLHEGDVFLGANGELSALVATERIVFSDGVKVYNFTVNGNHNYFVIAETDEFGQTSILVHNAKYGPSRDFNAGNLKDIPASKLKTQGIDPHAFKAEYVERNAISEFDIKKDKLTGELIIVPHKPGTGIPPIPTGWFIDLD